MLVLAETHVPAQLVGYDCFFEQLSLRIQACQDLDMNILYMNMDNKACKLFIFETRSSVISRQIEKPIGRFIRKTNVRYDKSPKLCVTNIFENVTK